MLYTIRETIEFKTIFIRCSKREKMCPYDTGCKPFCLDTLNYCRIAHTVKTLSTVLRLSTSGMLIKKKAKRDC